MSVSRVLARAFRRKKFGDPSNLIIANQAYKKALIAEKNRIKLSDWRPSTPKEQIETITQNMIEDKDKSYFVNERLIRGSVLFPTSISLVPVIYHFGIIDFFSMDFGFPIMMLSAAFSGMVGHSLSESTYLSQIRRLHRINSGLDKAMKEKEQKREKEKNSAQLYRTTRAILKADLDKFVNEENMDYDRALILASRSDNLDTVRILVEIFNANIHIGMDEPLHSACKYGHLPIVEYLLDAGISVHSCNDFPLLIACKYGHFHIVKLLLKRGADIHAGDNLFNIAKENGHSSIVNLLKEWKNKSSN